MGQINITPQCPIVLVNGKINSNVVPLLKPYCEIRQWQESDIMPIEKLIEFIPEADALIVAYRSKITNEVIRQGKHLKIVAQAFVGYENVDIDACTACGIPFCNAISASTNSVAELAMTLIFASARNLVLSNRYVCSGQWKEYKQTQNSLGIELQGATLGIIGMGRIGVTIARKAQGCGINVIYHNRHLRNDIEAEHMQFVSKEDLYHMSDVIVDVLPSTSETHQIIGMADFVAMKSSAIFINVGRGSTVQTNALLEALKHGEIAGAALDVVDVEPLPSNHPLLLLPNVIITPHIGGRTHSAWINKAKQTAQNVLNSFEGKPLQDCLNPEVLYQKKI